nr:NADH dehydrogenase subunit 2 [Frankliniella intonsa]
MKKMFFFNSAKFYILIFLSIVMGMSSSNFMSMWMSIEINFYSFLPILVTENLFEAEKSIMTYFWIQSIASTGIVMIILSMKIFSSEEFYTIMMFNFLFLKMAIFPFQFWMISMIEKLSWFVTAFILSVQKFLPFILIASMMCLKNFFYIILINSIVAGVSGLKTFSMRKIMVFSSMNHFSIMLFSMTFSKKTTLLYILFYTLMNFMIYKPFKKMNMNFLFQTFSKKKAYSFLILIILLNMMGVPPFLGFVPKSMVFIFFLTKNMFFFSLFVLMSNTLSSFFYLRMLISSMTMNMNFMNSIHLKKDLKMFSVFLIFPFMMNFLML